jgi:hypothetical protein
LVSVTPETALFDTPIDVAPDPECAAAIELARDAAIEMAEGRVGAHRGVRAEGQYLVTHAFDAELPGYVGWHWAVTVGRVAGFEPTVDEVVLLPGADALLPPAWVPWNERVQRGDLSPGDLLPPAPDDSRLTPAYLLSDDPQVEEVAFELGLGRVRVLSRVGRLDAADRWVAGDGGPDTPMAKQAPGRCGTCAFLLPLEGSMKAAFGVCANEIADTDGRIVTVDHGCGAHSEATIEPDQVEQGEVYDDAAIDLLDIDPVDDEPIDEVSVNEPTDEVSVNEPADDVSVDEPIDEVSVDEPAEVES